MLGNLSVDSLSISNFSGKIAIVVEGCINISYTRLKVSPTNFIGQKILINSTCLLGEFAKVELPPSNCVSQYSIAYIENTVVFFSRSLDKPFTLECNPEGVGGAIAGGILLFVVLLVVVVLSSNEKLRKKMFPFRSRKMIDVNKGN